ncbi:MAG: glycosyltransferase family 4 protein [Sulfurimonadaceae bacterium]|jgi:glycosyltransferase involved in cell wall biosynthesis|nr:glycosyltransferase family 4 protein [Sulfurimonadaceae bacterium]
MKKIMEICLSPDAGGLELYMVRAGLYLENKTPIFSVINQDGKLASYYNEKSNLIKMKKPSYLGAFAFAKKLAHAIDIHEIDVVHLHWTKDLPFVVLAKVLSKRKPALIQTRNMTMTRFKGDFYHKWLYKNLDMMHAVTHQVKEQLETFIPKEVRPDIEVLYMGAETPSKITAEEKDRLRKDYKIKEQFTVGIVGRIEKEKGQYLVIDAVEKLIQKGHEAQVLIVGHAMDDIYLEELKADVKRKDMNEHVIFTGFTKEAQKLMQLCDALVLATPRETFGLVLIEAMACGICVIGTNNGGPLEIIDDNETGLLFLKDNSDDLSQKIELLINDKEFKDKLALAGQTKAKEQFNATNQFEKLHLILQKLAEDTKNKANKL